MTYTLRKYPDPVLLSPAEPADLFQDAAHIIAVEKAAEKGFGWGNLLGLAAPQMGIPKRFFLALGEMYINPEITEYSDEIYVAEEGCYSLEEGRFDHKVTRSKWIIMSWTDKKGKHHTKRFEDNQAQVMQHEYDHLLGKLCSGQK